MERIEPRIIRWVELLFQTDVTSKKCVWPIPKSTRLNHTQITLREVRARLTPRPLHALEQQLHGAQRASVCLCSRTVHISYSCCFSKCMYICVWQEKILQTPHCSNNNLALKIRLNQHTYMVLTGLPALPSWSASWSPNKTSWKCPKTL